MTEAIAKLKAKLFSRISARDLFIDPDSEQEIEERPAWQPHQKTFGGLKYRILIREVAFIEIVHAGEKQFNIFITLPQLDGTTRVRVSTDAQFDQVDLVARQVIETVLNDH